MSDIQISIIISTYNSPQWLRKVIYGYAAQSYKNFEILIADDGSGQETFETIEELKQAFDFPIVHVWHEDDGFRKTEILNKAIVASSADYILMSDGDCIPRFDFVETHLKYREKGFFLSGGYFKLPMNISQLITREDVKLGNCFDISWLKSKGLKSTIKNFKISAKGSFATLLNKYTPTKASWNGHNASGWKSDFLKVNGFDQRMQYGGEDREFGERLFNLGIKSKQIRYSAICVHLDHARGYVNQEMINKNLAIRKETKEQNITRTKYGISQ